MMHPTADLSLISEASYIEDDTDREKNRYHYQRYATNTIENNELPSPNSSEHSMGSIKQVRFHPSVQTPSTSHHRREIRIENTRDAYLYDDLTDEITMVTSDVPCDNFSPNFGNDKYTSSENVLDCASYPLASEELHPKPASDTSLWLTAPTADSDTLNSNGMRETNLAWNSDNQKEASFFRTSDHLPRPPVGCQYPGLIVPSSSVNDPQRQYHDSRSPIPRDYPRSASPSEEYLPSISPVSESRQTDLYPILPEVDYFDGSHDFSEPKLASARLLIDQINNLSTRLNRESSSGPTQRALHEATRLVEEACSSTNSHNKTARLSFDPGLALNIPDQVCTFNNLMELSVDESEIVRQERERIAKERKQMALVRKRAAKKKLEIPPCDLLEFFDPNRHVFQSVNLHVRGLPSYLPSLTSASDEFVTVFHDRLISDFVRMNT